jgi:hypothetical protein
MGRAPLRASRARPRAACARESSSRLAALAAAASLSATLVLAGCGKKEDEAPPPLGFEFDTTAADTARLATGDALLTEFEPYRASNGALRARGRFALPDGARIQVSVRRDGAEIGREQVLLRAGGFDTPPFALGKQFPVDDYEFEISTQFNSVWQPAHVLAATRSGLALRGPGIRRGMQGEAVYRITMEKRL